MNENDTNLTRKVHYNKWIIKFIKRESSLSLENFWKRWKRVMDGGVYKGKEKGLKWNIGSWRDGWE
jgi:hypothetical protein